MGIFIRQQNFQMVWRGDFNKDEVSFFLKYAQGDLKEQLLTRKDQIKVKYLDYDWSLNGS